MGLGTFLDDRKYPPTTLRGLQFLAFKDTAVIQRPSGTSDSGGGVTTIWQNVGTVSCRVTAMSGQPRLVAGRIDERSTHVISAPVTADIEPEHRSSSQAGVRSRSRTPRTQPTARSRASRLS